MVLALGEVILQGGDKDNKWVGKIYTGQIPKASDALGTFLW